MLLFGISTCAVAGERPNVVWIISEDNSKHYLRHFDPNGAATPNIESLADNGVTFDRAFSNAPVCSVARTTLITSCYAPRLATQFHRAIRKPTLPETHPFFPEVLRQAGYYTSNRSKQDYNAVLSPEVWDASNKKASWRNRPDNSMPFFHVQTINTTHESRLHFDVDKMQNPTTTHPDEIVVPSYLPDTQTVRYTIAKYHDQMKVMDDKVGQIVSELREDNVLENTFIFYFGDHGGVLPRSKGYLFETGLHVPLIVRVPENFSDRVDRDAGSRCNGFVEFVDFGPSVLSLCDADIPQAYDGKPFLGDQASATDVDRRDETIGYCDRMDEKYDLNRSLRIGNIKYIRHFEPLYPDGLTNLYRYKMIAYQQWREMYRSGDLDSTQAAFFEPRRPESLYDLANDPEETNNLAEDPAYRSDLLRMRTRLMQRLQDWPDLSLLTELYLIDDAAGDPVQYGRNATADIARYLETVNLCLQPFSQVRPLLVQSIEDQDPLVRYWAITAANSMDGDVAELLPQIEKKMVDVEPFVVAKAIEFVAKHGPGPAGENATPADLAANRYDDVRPFMYRSLNRVLSEAEALNVLRTAVFLSENYQSEIPLEMKRAGLDMLRPETDAESLAYWNYLRTLQTEP